MTAKDTKKAKVEHDETKPNPRDNKWLAKLLGEGATFSIFIASAYWVSFFFEKSFLNYFGIPDEFVHVSIDSVIGRYWYVFFPVTLSYWVVSNTPTTVLAFFRYSFFWIFAASLAAFHYFFQGLDFWTILFGLAAIWSFWLGFVVPVFKLGVLFPEALKIWHERSVFRFGDVTEPLRPFALVIFLATFCFVLGPPLGLISGTVAAADKRSFASFIEDNKEWIIVEQEGSTWLAVVYDSTHKTVTGEFVALDASSLATKRLSIKKVEFLARFVQ